MPVNNPSTQIYQVRRTCRPSCEPCPGSSGDCPHTQQCLSLRCFHISLALTRPRGKQGRGYSFCAFERTGWQRKVILSVKSEHPYPTSGIYLVCMYVCMYAYEPAYKNHPEVQCGSLVGHIVWAPPSSLNKSFPTKSHQKVAHHREKPHKV